jgi:hypothetical protein
MTARRVEYVPLGDLAAMRDPANPKAHDLGAVVSSIRRFGFTAPVVVDERTGRLAAGHGRVEALEVLHADDPATPPDGVHRDGDRGWLVPAVRGWLSRDDAEARAYLVADNQLTTAGGWDDGALAALLHDLAASGVDVRTGVGFSDDDLAALLDAPTFIPDAGEAPRLAQRQVLVCGRCGALVDPATAERVDVDG